MPRSDRMFEIIQILRRANGPVRAGDIARELEVSKRTICRDIATLQAMRTPIWGEAGIGYEMRRGYDLPPVNFDVEEAEAVAVGLSMIARTGDHALTRAAQRAARKLAEAAPPTDGLIASSWGAMAPSHVDPSVIRGAIRDEQVLQLSYLDAEGRATERDVWPLALIYYSDALMAVCWCTLRDDFRHFRLDRMSECAPIEASFTGRGAGLRARWEDTLKAQTISTH